MSPDRNRERRTSSSAIWRFRSGVARVKGGGTGSAVALMAVCMPTHSHYSTQEADRQSRACRSVQLPAIAGELNVFRNSIYWMQRPPNVTSQSADRRGARPNVCIDAAIWTIGEAHSGRTIIVTCCPSSVATCVLSGSFCHSWANVPDAKLAAVINAPTARARNQTQPIE